MRQKHPFEQFRSDPESVDAWRAVLALPITRTVLGMLRENGPEFIQAPYGLTEIDIARRYGHVIGYTHHHQLLEDMSKVWPLAETPPDPSYEPVEPE